MVATPEKVSTWKILAITKYQELHVGALFNFFFSFSIEFYLAVSFQLVNFSKRFNLHHFSRTCLCFWPPWGFIRPSGLTQFQGSVLWLAGGVKLGGRHLLMPLSCALPSTLPPPDSATRTRAASCHQSDHPAGSSAMSRAREEKLEISN